MRSASNGYIQETQHLNNESILMKTTIKLFTAAAVIFAAVTTSPEARATAVTLDGSAHYTIRNTEVYYGGGVAQSGRYQNLGSGYYHNTTYGIEFLTNSSTHRSGSLSFDFWGMPYYGATSGLILMTRGLDRLAAMSSVTTLSRSGLAVSLNARRFPELDLWEYTINGWRFRDAFRFTQKDLL